MGNGDWVEGIHNASETVYLMFYIQFQNYTSDLITKAWTFAFSNATSGAIPYRFICVKHPKYMPLIVVVKDREKALKL